MRYLKRTVRIEWGQCDPAGIVYFPRYFEIFDNNTTALLEQAIGMTKFQLVQAYDLVGYPLVDVGAKFYLSSRYGDDVEVETEITHLGRSSFKLDHKLLNQGKLAVEGHEARVLVGHDPDEPGKLKSRPFPPEVLAKLG